MIQKHKMEKANKKKKLLVMLEGITLRTICLTECMNSIHIIQKKVIHQSQEKVRFQVKSNHLLPDK